MEFWPAKKHTETDCFTESAGNGMKPASCSANAAWSTARGFRRAWHDNGQLQLEVSTVRGEFCGRNRIWLRDGTLISERFYLRGRIVSPEKYREAAARDKTLPKFRGKPATLRADNASTQRRIHRVATTW